MEEAAPLKYEHATPRVRLRPTKNVETHYIDEIDAEFSVALLFRTERAGNMFLAVIFFFFFLALSLSPSTVSSSETNMPLFITPLIKCDWLQMSV